MGQKRALLGFVAVLAALPHHARSQATPVAPSTSASEVETRRQQAPACAVKNKGYSDLHVPTLNGGLAFDAVECQQKCADSKQCLGFTFYVISTGCWLQGISGTLPPLEDIQGTWSGPKACDSGDSGDSGGPGGPLGNALEWVKEVPEEAEEVGEEIGEEAEDVLKSVTGNSTNGTNETLLMEAEDGLQELEQVVEKNGFPLWIGAAFLVIVGIVYLVFGGGFDGSGRRRQCGALMGDWHNSIGSESDTEEEKSMEPPRSRSRFSSRGSR